MHPRFPGPNGLHYDKIAAGRYRTLCDHHVQTGFVVPTAIFSQEAGIRLYADGWLCVQAGYIWDGPSGPSIHTTTFLRGSLYHDALYDLMRQKLLGQEFRQPADALLRDVCIEDGMSSIRGAWVYAGVRTFGGIYAGQEPKAANRRDR